MERRYKLVKQDENNCDQYLIGFFETEMQAQSAKPAVFEKYRDWVKNVKNLIVKPVDPKVIANPVCTDYMHYVRSLIPDKEWERVIKSDASAEISSNSLMCGGATYYHLSNLIDKNWCVVDFGASYAAQSYLFENHKRYIAIEPFPKDIGDWHFEMFHAPKMELYSMSGQKFLKEVFPTLGLDIDKTMAIINYVPSEELCKMVRETFQNVWSYYPSL